MKLILSILIVFSSLIQAQDQNFTQSIKGTITDAETQTTLPGANIIVTDIDPLMGATSDLDGNFIIENVPIGRRNIKISFIGYEDVYYNELVLITGSELVINVKLTEAVNTLNEVTITAEDVLGEPINSMVTNSAQRITIESTSRVAAGINDPARTVQSFAGVASFDDENNEIVVRGNTPRGMLWRMEGIEIPNPNHFSDGEGASGGGVSALSTQVLDNSDFYTGAFAAEYGNAISSVFDLKLRTGNDTKREYTLQVGVMGVQAAMEGPFSKKSKATYLFNYRYSTTSLLNNLGFNIGDSDVYPEWQDLSLNINIPTKKAGRFNVWGLGGISKSANLAEQDTANWEYRSDAYSDSEKQVLGIIGVSNNYLLANNKTYFKTTIAYSYTNNIYLEDSINYDNQITNIENDDYIYSTITGSFLANHKFNSQHSFRTGIIYANQGFDLHGQQLNYDDGETEVRVNQSGDINRLQSYFQWKYRITPFIDLNTGIHATYLTINNDYAVEPRIGLSWKVNPKNRLSFGLGLHSRAEPASTYMAEQELDNGLSVQPNTDLKMTRALHAVAGYSWNFAQNFNFRAEVYYQYLYKVPVQVNDTTGTISALNFSNGYTTEKLDNEGTGTNYGLELTLEKSFSRNYYIMATISLFQSFYTMPGFEERNSRFNSNYIYNIIGGKEFKVGKGKQNIISANLRMIWRGGYRTIPVDLNASISAGEEVRDYDQAFETHAPDYFRLDLGVSYRKNKPTWSWILSLNIQNLTDNANVWDEYYDSERETMQQVYMVGLIPILNYKVEF